MSTLIKRLFWIGLGLVALTSVVIGFKNGLRLIDFQWLPVRIMVNGENPYLYSLNRIPFMGCQVDANQVPSCLALLAPFALLPRETANTIWDICNLGFTAAFFWCLWKLWFKDGIGVKWFWFVIVLTLTGAPWRVLIGNGQHLMFSLAFFFAAYFAARSGGKWIAGVLLAASLFKYTTIAPMCLIFLVRREWKVIFMCAGVHVALTLGAGLYLGENPIVLVLQSLKVGGMLVAQGDADLASAIRSFGVENVGSLALVGYLFYGLLALAVAFLGCREELLGLSIFAVISNVMFYHRIYDFVVLIIPLVLILQSACRAWVVRALVAINIVACFYGFRVFDGLSVPYNRVAFGFFLQNALLLSLLWLTWGMSWFACKRGMPSHDP